MKRILASILAVVMIVASVTGCSTEKAKEKPRDTDENHHYLYLRKAQKAIMPRQFFSTAKPVRAKRSL